MLLTEKIPSFGLNAGSAVNPARDFSPRLFTLIAGWEEPFSVFPITLFKFPISMSLMTTGIWPLVLDPASSAARRSRPRCSHLRRHDQRSPPGGISLLLPTLCSDNSRDQKYENSLVWSLALLWHSAIFSSLSWSLFVIYWEYLKHGQLPNLSNRRLYVCNIHWHPIIKLWCKV